MKKFEGSSLGKCVLKLRLLIYFTLSPNPTVVIAIKLHQNPSNNPGQTRLEKSSLFERDSSAHVINPDISANNKQITRKGHKSRYAWITSLRIFSSDFLSEK